MASLKKVAEAARAAVDSLPVQQLVDAEQALDDAAVQWQECTAGSTDPAADEVHGLLHTAKDDLDNARHAATVAVPAAVERWITALGVGSMPRPAAPEPPGERDRVTVSPTERARRLDACRRRLDPGVEGRAAHGWWVDAQGGEHPLKSGRGGPWGEAAAQFARARGMAPGSSTLFLARHIEIQFAMRMRAQGLVEETIVIDRVPCGSEDPGEWTCHEKLDQFLPPGAALTVVVRDGRRFRYRGAPE